MEETPRSTRRNGQIDGESMPFVSSAVDAASGRVRVTVVQRGGRTVERLQALLGRDRVEIRLPGEERAIAGRPIGVDVTATGTGPQPLLRIDMTFATDTDDTEAAGETLDTRLARIEAKLDRLLALVQAGTNAPGT